MEVVEASIRSLDNSSETPSGGRLLKIEPSELRFTFEPKKQISCCLHLSNLMNGPVAFKVLTTNKTVYAVRPNTGIILPGTTCGITVTMRAQNEPCTANECKDKFKIQSVLVSASADLNHITKNVFDKEEGLSIEEYKLPVVYLSTALPLSLESEQANTLLTDGTNLNSSQMSTMEMPDVIKFPFEANKQISSSLQFSNKTANYVAFKVMTTNPKNYSARPIRGVMVPQSTFSITVTMQAQKAPPNAPSKDKFLIRSAVVSPSTTEKDINWDLFGEDGLVKDHKLRAIHTLSPKAAIPAAEGSEEFSSERVLLMQDDSSNNSQEIPWHDGETNMGTPSIFGRISDFLGLTSSQFRSYDQYKKLV
ncbi:vesicle-associated protein 1-4-like [Coffea arabica]|uniref:Vesicle-associated protein 1-4-like n=1 Tax=Coffea arabica TaxID=13443 RepID=A0ABM4VKQ3_COFAR